MPEDKEFSTKSRLVALVLAWFLGIFGAHRFYTGKIGTAILMICTIGGFGLWWLIDIVTIVCGYFRDKDGRRVFKWFESGSV